MSLFHRDAYANYFSLKSHFCLILSVFYNEIISNTFLDFQRTFIINY